MSDSIMESPAALSNLLEILSRPGALDALTFFNTLINSSLVIFLNTKSVCFYRRTRVRKSL